MSLSRSLKNYIFVCSIGILSATCANAQSWRVNDGVSPLGVRTATLFVQKHEFAFRITCNETAAESGMLNLMFFGPTLPRLYGTDGQEKTLLLSFNMPDDTSLIQKWDAYYFDGGLGDQAWIGGVKASNRMLNAFSAATDISLLNTDHELIYVFPAKGTAAGTKQLRDTCGIG